MLLKSGLIRVGQKQIDRFSLVMRFTLLLWLTLQVTAKPGQMCTGLPCLLTLGLILPLALRSQSAEAEDTRRLHMILEGAVHRPSTKVVMFGMGRKLVHNYPSADRSTMSR